MLSGHNRDALSRALRFVFMVLGSFAYLSASAQQVLTDNDFDVSVTAPAYVSEHPRVVVDQAHHNLHTIEGHYKPLAKLLVDDGYQVEPGTAPFEAPALHGVAVLVVSNALGSTATPPPHGHASVHEFRVRRYTTVG